MVISSIFHPRLALLSVVAPNRAAPAIMAGVFCSMQSFRSRRSTAPLGAQSHLLSNGPGAGWAKAGAADATRMARETHRLNGALDLTVTSSRPAERSRALALRKSL
jgi:hypothetical protein